MLNEVNLREVVFFSDLTARSVRQETPRNALS